MFVLDSTIKHAEPIVKVKGIVINILMLSRGGENTRASSATQKAEDRESVT